MARTVNPFGLTIEPEPDASLPGDRPHHARIIMPPYGYIPAHYHEPGPDGIFDHANAEIYIWQSGGTMHIFIRDSSETLWRTVKLSELNPVVAILAGWRHGAAVYAESVIFHALSRVDHFRPLEQGGNVHRLDDDDQPAAIVQLMNFGTMARS